MPRWITRKSVDGVAVRHPIPCYERTSIAAVPGIRTVEECIQLLLEEDEHIGGELDQGAIAIHRAGKVVGYLEVRRLDDPLDLTLAPEALRDLSTGELHSKLRNACTTLALLDDFESTFESSDEERERIKAMTEEEQSQLRVRSVRAIDEVRVELRRRARESGR